MKHTLSLVVVLLAVWFLWSGHTEPLLLALGAVSCVTVVWLVRRMYLIDKEAAPLEIAPRALLYLPWLLWQIVLANIDVALRILTPGLPIQPRVIRIRAGQRTDMGRTIYANSITLTPGTVSIDMEGDRITVHALTRKAAADLQSGKMERRVRRIEGGR